MKNSTHPNNLEEANTEIYAVLGAMNGADIEAIAFLVLMQAAKSAQEDLKAIMNQVKKINKEKQKQRELMSELASKSLLKDGKDLSEKQKLVLIKYVFGPC